VRVGVYTAVYGGHDNLKNQPEQTVDCDFICFTDRVGTAHDQGWNVIRAKRREAHPRMRAKFFKVLSHRVFPHGRLAWRHDPVGALLGRRTRYDALVWIDGSIQIRSPRFVEEFVGRIGGTGWAMFRHPDRDCVYHELGASLPMPKYRGLPLERQVASYRVEGYPARRGLMACTVIARRADDPRLARINEAWWRENVRWTYQDQLSLPVVLWRQGLSYDPVEMNLWDNPWFRWVPHTSEL
jgi:hypothetical protein